MIHVPFVTELFEGKSRPGHFDGVATIVAKLFNIVSPKSAYFGEKDLQQCAVIRKLVEDLNFTINIIICETLREENGLAKSSRNIYLSENEFLVAPMLYMSLIEAKTALINGFSCQEVLVNSRDFLSNNSFDVDYFELVDRQTMHPLIAINDHASLIVAAHLGTTRLIDNVRVVG
jgi:pantoate--beta-alanine ligase